MIYVYLNVEQPFSGITTVLTMAFVGIDNRVDLPKVSYSTAIDYFVGMCFAFVLATIIQFAGVHFFTKHGSGETFPESDLDDNEDDGEQVGSECQTKPNSVSKIDKVSRVVFPFIFITFNIFYWVIYLDNDDGVEYLT